MRDSTNQGCTRYFKSPSAGVIKSRTDDRGGSKRGSRIVKNDRGGSRRGSKRGSKMTGEDPNENPNENRESKNENRESKTRIENRNENRENDRGESKRESKTTGENPNENRKRQGRIQTRIENPREDYCNKLQWKPRFTTGTSGTTRPDSLSIVRNSVGTLRIARELSGIVENC